MIGGTEVMQPFLRLSGFTKAERLHMTDRVSEAIAQSDAWITDFHIYSNVSICINFEVPIAQLNQLATALQETGLHLSEDSMQQLAHPHQLPLKQELTGTLQITFIHNEPDLLREVPAVPG
jgi:hypothetical protein